MNADNEPNVRRAASSRCGASSSIRRTSGLRSSTTLPFSVGGNASTQRRATTSSVHRSHALGSWRATMWKWLLMMQ